ncbi:MULTISPECIES: adaptor protein MecA [Enterococcus]|uniref:Adapter protein MecA n=1 Tax=Enterococcus mundtii TaxID=53346 RepID=A0ABQ0VK55_ENTMU|nr:MULTISPECIES: adaptor protein MecA [Enterococcus]GEN19198.1 adapter protein MecA [Ligilactobacillus acidipiscis]AUB53717.1 adaptor protein MecA [Enterococcus mundtii]MZZ59725.1 adaptor protein MecA [Enterococcus mundtii]MZZ62880.1 adaptor protein MecA [Enterococcus mundtii]MZZ69749.1 adaptor protein MecA [Enterococcus mundtii]
MEMEHINENTIRVMIGHEDLEERGVSFLDLLGNHREIENFFYSILEEVDIEEEFQSSEAVTFQVLPKGDGLELFISKNMPDEEIGQNNESTLNSADVSEFLQGQMLANEEESDLTESTTASEQRAIFVFSDFEQVIQLANDVQLESAWTDLYQLEERYYLVVHFWMENLNQTDVENQYARILEFAEKSARTPEALNEYGQQLMERNALERVKFYFE